MKRKLAAFIFTLLVISGLAVTVYAAAGTIDQSYEAAAMATQRQIQYHQPLGQEFVPSMPLISGVEVWVVSMNPQYGPAEITLSIRESALPEQIIASKAVNSLDPYYDNWLYFEFDAPVPVIPGKVYVIEVRSNNGTHGLYSNNDGYAAECEIIWTYLRFEYEDLLFRTYGTETPVMNKITPTAAPDIARIILAAEGVDPNQSTGKGKDRIHHNLISETARIMGPRTLFNGIKMSVTEEDAQVCNPAYWDAVLAFLNGYGFGFDYTLYDYIADQP